MASKSMTAVAFVLASTMACGAVVDESDTGNAAEDESAEAARGEVTGALMDQGYVPEPLDRPLPAFELRFEQKMWLIPDLEDEPYRFSTRARCVMRLEKLWDPARHHAIDIPITECH